MMHTTDFPMLIIISVTGRLLRKAVNIARERGIADAILVGDEAKMSTIEKNMSVNIDKFKIINEPDPKADAI